MANSFWDYAVRTQSKRADSLGDFLRLTARGVLLRPTREPNSAAELRQILEALGVEIPSEMSGRLWQNFRKYRSDAASREAE